MNIIFAGMKIQLNKKAFYSLGSCGLRLNFTILQAFSIACDQHWNKTVNLKSFHYLQKLSISILMKIFVEKHAP